jgi:hypothetical protein
MKTKDLPRNIGNLRGESWEGKGRDVRSPSGQNLITKKIRGEENTLEITADQRGLPRIEPFSFRMILL